MAAEDLACKKCGVTAADARLDKCGVCSKYFCPDCAHRAYGGRRFCSPECARSYYFHGEMDDDDDIGLDDDEE